MKPVASFLTIFLAGSYLFGGEEGVERQQRKTFFPSGSIRSVQTIVSSPKQEPVAHGEEVSFYPNGAIKAKGALLLGKKHGKWLFVDEDGRITEGEFQNGMRSGRWVQRSLTREIRVDEHYVSSRLHGPRTTYFENGQLATEEFYVNGLRQGSAKSWYPNGLHATEEAWTGGKRHGPFRRWDEYGVQLVSGQYTMGVPTGEWEWRDLNDDLVQSSNLGSGTGTFYQYVVTGESKGDRRVVLRKEVPLRQGKIDGPQKTYFPDGKLQARLLFQRGNRQGTFSEWSSNGGKLREGEYRSDELVRMREYYPSDAKEAKPVVRESMAPDGDRLLIKEFSKDGTLLSEMQMLNGKPDGLTKVYYPDGVLMREGRYLGGEKEGEWKEYYSDGAIRSVQSFAFGSENGPAEEWYAVDAESDAQRAAAGSYANGKRDGQWLAWYPDGSLRAKRSYRYGLEDADYQEFWPAAEGEEAQQQRIQGTFQLGKKEGDWVTWFASGQKKSITHFRNGKEHGVAEEWYDAKKSKKQLTRIKGEFVDGKQHGKWMAYFPDGKVQLEQNYDLGKLQGTTKQYYDTHVLKSEIYYEGGVQEGEAVTYYPNKKRKTKAGYAEGLLHGEFLLYHENGKVWTRGAYQRGMPDGEWKWFGKDGRTILESSSFRGGSGTMYAFYPDGERKRATEYLRGVKSGQQTIWYRDGQVKAESHWNESLLHGEFKEYHESGELASSALYHNGRLQGEFASWYGNQKPRLNLTYYQDSLDGLSQEWYENGTLKTAGMWEKGVRQGLWKWYDRYGDQLFEIQYEHGLVVRSTAPEEGTLLEAASR